MATNKIKRVLIGKVVNNSRDKTISVLVERRVKHPIYPKIIRRSTKIHAHDAKNSAQSGDIVKVSATRPFSKTKHWNLVEVVEHLEDID